MAETGVLEEAREVCETCDDDAGVETETRETEVCERESIPVEVVCTVLLRDGVCEETLVDSVAFEDATDDIMALREVTCEEDIVALDDTSVEIETRETELWLRGLMLELEAVGET